MVEHRRRNAAAALGVVLLAMAVGVTLRWRPDAPLLTTNGGGRLAPPVEVPDLHDETKTVALRHGLGRPIVLNFWASWCVPCQKELPALQRIHEQTRSDVEFLGMNHQDNREDALELLEDTGVDYTSGFDPQGSVAEAYALYGMPTTVFISAEGHVLATRTGELSDRELERALSDLFGVDAQ